MAFSARHACALGLRFTARRGMSSQLNGISIEHTSIGNKHNPAVLLIMGHSCTMTQWSPFDQQLANAGFHVIKFDNRDMGRTQRFDDILAEPEKCMSSGPNPLEGKKDISAYCISDMADDAVAVLDHYGVDKAHIVGASMGGLICQVTGVRHPSRCKSLTPIMTAVNLNEAVGRGMAKDGGAFMGKLMNSGSPPGKDATLQEFLDSKLKHWHMMMTDPAWPELDEDAIKQIKDSFTADYERGGFDYDGRGALRQSLAINEFERSMLASHLEGLKKLSCPTLVLHGIYDPLIPIESGRELARSIPGARIVEYLGGHNFGNHPTVRDTIRSAIAEHLTAAESM
eukprot:TRINITY_DN108954_c0_g1_i1.p1 TRINITY_DN108954_c0_g1~~TRINITY_DN108954_c0_g1_i1.p1  ORF type:complete len:341 (-),score=44.36 TRINITY_DN108954_c0_g1_i1:49-1071(-)